MCSTHALRCCGCAAEDAYTAAPVWGTVPGMEYEIKRREVNFAAKNVVRDLAVEAKLKKEERKKKKSEEGEGDASS